MKPGDLRLFVEDSDRLGDDMFSGRVVLLLQLSEAQDPANPCWDVLVGGRMYRMNKSMLRFWSTPVQMGESYDMI
jgi:hypothetical protein